MEETNIPTQATVSTLLSDVRSIVEQGLQEAYHNVNTIAVHTYWLVGKRIVEEEQKGAKRAEYGKQIIKLLSDVLLVEYGNSFNEKNLRAFRALFLMFNDLEIGTRVFQILHGAISALCCVL